MTDENKPSIAELHRLREDMPTGQWALTSDEGARVTIQLLRAAPVLLEIAATGLAWAAAEDALQSAPPGVARVLAAICATEAFDKHRTALGKVCS